MNKDNVISFENRELFEDPLTDLIRTGARQLIALGVEAELDELMAKYAGQHTETGRQAVVRSGYHRQRQIQTGIGAVTVKIPKVRSTTGEPVTFRSWLIPPYVRKTRTLEAFVPWLYLKGISSGGDGSSRSGISSISGLSVGSLMRTDCGSRQETCSTVLPASDTAGKT